VSTVFFARIALLLALASSVFGQALTQVNGSVTDPSGAAVVGATVEATNLATSISRETKTDNSGLYVFPQIAPGNYRLTVSAAGFSKSTVDNITLLVNTP
jgi:protocatechuate 3,4-dioxygenase beta subunit